MYKLYCSWESERKEVVETSVQEKKVEKKKSDYLQVSFVQKLIGIWCVEIFIEVLSFYVSVVSDKLCR